MKNLNKRDAAVSIVVEKILSKSRVDLKNVRLSSNPLAPYLAYCIFLEWNTVAGEVATLVNV